MDTGNLPAGRQLVTLVNRNTAMYVDPAQIVEASADGAPRSVVVHELHEGGFVAAYAQTATRSTDTRRRRSPAGVRVSWRGAGPASHSHRRGLRHIFTPLAIAAQVTIASAGALAVAHAAIENRLQLHVHPSRSR